MKMVEWKKYIAFCQEGIKLWQIFVLLSMTIMLSSCYHRHMPRQKQDVVVKYTDRQIDSISFSTNHHYTNKFNFVVFKDSLMLISQQPEEYLSHLPIDSFYVKKNRLLVVTDIRMVPQDSIDSVWIQLATEDNTFGWTRESNMLPKVVPDDPISQFIMTFSNIHLLIFLIVIVLISVAYLVRKIFHNNAKIVHFNDIDSPYPTALVLMVSVSATFYATLQTFEPEVWRNFFFHPSLNPFAVPSILGFFLATVWAILILSIACVDEVHQRLSFGGGMLYLGGLVSVCAVDYIVFSITTLYYIGYFILVGYFIFAVHAYMNPYKKKKLKR